MKDIGMVKMCHPGDGSGIKVWGLKQYRERTYVDRGSLYNRRHELLPVVNGRCRITDARVKHGLGNDPCTRV
jgi:hypothetical protein